MAINLGFSRGGSTGSKGQAIMITCANILALDPEFAIAPRVFLFGGSLFGFFVGFCVKLAAAPRRMHPLRVSNGKTPRPLTLRWIN